MVPAKRASIVGHAGRTRPSQLAGRLAHASDPDPLSSPRLPRVIAGGSVSACRLAIPTAQALR